jgi:hypothetical protein
MKMKNLENNIVSTNEKKRSYKTPEITTVKIDHEISLVMMSDPPVEPPTMSLKPKFLSIIPLK